MSLRTLGRGILPVAALVTAGLTLTACGPGNNDASGSATPSSSPSASSPSSPAPSPSSSPPSAPSSSPAGSGGSSGSGGSVSESVPGVIDCGKSLSKLEIRPKSILLACSDSTAGLQNLTWSHWGRNTLTGSPDDGPTPSATATATGEFFLNDCDPDCATGHAHTYPVKVTLSVVNSSPLKSGDTYFARASLTWQGAKPPAGTKTTFVLQDPTAS
ncbi:hypothetical protein [Streptomyces montanisoli]|uniref:LppP/LprE family lipoprotein n=1 Tax=Streptomyces montanisoli TaxID=2798581 RepID=A0A940MA89_9ACTN|nr:hypothetical protein [Streptomyces montanisoli]MBP0456350.1 hypothetical protein [Streptomyces montanisoli]